MSGRSHGIQRGLTSVELLIAIIGITFLVVVGTVAVRQGTAPETLMAAIAGLLFDAGALVVVLGWAAYLRHRASLTRGWFISRLMLATERGVSLIGALEVMEKDARGLPRLIAERCRFALLDGARLSDGLERFRRQFSPLHLSVIQIGEETGKLPQALRALRRHHEALSKARHRLILNLLYPTFVTFFLVCVLSFMSAYIWPQLSEIEAEYGDFGWLPYIRGLIPPTGVLARGMLLGLSVVLIALAIGYRSTGSGLMTEAWDVVKWHLPFFRQYEMRTGLALFSSTVAEMLRVGVPLHQAVETASLIRVNRCLQKRLRASAARLREGKTASGAFSSEFGYPPTFSWAVSVGERSGELASSLSKVGSSLSRRLELSLNRAIEFAFPVSMILLGAGAGLFALSVMSFLRGLMDALESAI